MFCLECHMYNSHIKCRLFATSHIAIIYELSFAWSATCIIHVSTVLCVPRHFNHLGLTTISDQGSEPAGILHFDWPADRQGSHWRLPFWILAVSVHGRQPHRQVKDGDLARLVAGAGYKLRITLTIVIPFVDLLNSWFSVSLIYCIFDLLYHWLFNIDFLYHWFIVWLICCIVDLLYQWFIVPLIYCIIDLL